MQPATFQIFLNATNILVNCCIQTKKVDYGNNKWSADATVELNRLSLQESDWNLGGNGILEHQTRGKRVQLCPLLTAPINRRITDSDEDSCTEVLNGSGDRKMTNGKW